MGCAYTIILLDYLGAASVVEGMEHFAQHFGMVLVAIVPVSAGWI